MIVIRTIRDLRHHLASLRGTTRIGLVPTMGALHAGHARCFETARCGADHVVATIFVNPTQFNDAADLAKYPRPEQHDIDVAAAAGVDTLFMPAAAEIYPPGDDTMVDPKGAALGYEGDARPGHFRGVATVCLKLFGIVRPDVAFFGQKDAQQVAVIRQLVRDFFLDLTIEVVATVRDADRLALSSRNVHLSAEERQRALAIPRALTAALRAQIRSADPAVAAREALDGLDVEYAAVATFDGRPTLVIAARAGATRLIDNVPLDRPQLAGLSPS